jgi:hypothetical protein
MSIRIMSKVWDSAPYEGGALLVLLALADYANDEGECWPKIETLATKARMSARQAQNIIRQFQSEGVISIQPGGGRGRASRYTIERVKPTSPFCSEERVKSDAERVKSATEKGEICDSAIRKESSLEPSKEPSAVFTVPIPEPEKQRQLVPWDPNCPDCRGEGMVPRLLSGAWRRVRCERCRGAGPPLLICRPATPQSENRQSLPERPEAANPAVKASA